MSHKKLESRVLNVRQTIIYNFSLNIQKHWYPRGVNGSFDNLTKTIQASHKSKFLNYCIKISMGVSFVICLPFFRLFSIVYQHLATKKITRKKETVPKSDSVSIATKLIPIKIAGLDNGNIIVLIILNFDIPSVFDISI